ncbi:FAD-binding oxidoreductase [Mesorhizobium sp. M0243]|uniref:NAD(P)/FAD-dependent oxidoreductase n=1 Tax=Mesorhizobium sp. M0243 TaxID=2956925 RepID=UPI00333CE32C
MKKALSNGCGSSIPLPRQSALRAIDRGFRELFPQFTTVPLKASWAGMIDAMPDVVPIVDRAAAIPGLVIATGMSGHGFGIGPGIGRVLSDLVQGNETGHNLYRFRQSRFSDGSPIRLGPSL